MSSEKVIFGEQTMDSIESDSMATRRFAMILLGSFAALALLLACMGVYGAMAYLVSQRTQEVGIRMALGAKKSDVLLPVFRSGARLATIGVAIGIVSTIGLTRLMRELLFDVSPTESRSDRVPARRAASIDPMRALRKE